MLVEKLQLENYRGIATAEIVFDPKLTVLVGKNGTGKTSILDALSSLLLPPQMLIPRQGVQPSAWGSQLFASDVRKQAGKCEMSLTFSLLGQTAKRKFVERAEFLKNGPVANTNSDGLWLYLHSDDWTPYPQALAIYYRQDRNFVGRSGQNGDSELTELIKDSISGRLGAISGLQSWWDRRDAQEARTVRDGDPSFRDGQLEVIRKLIKEIDGYKAIKYDSTAEPDGIYLEKNDGSLIHIYELSSGERAFFILLADLARRLQIMFPGLHVGEMPGIVLIDEIELNLHPTWQSKILPTLLTLFPACQFVVTTHSPQVVSSIGNEHVRTLSAESDGRLRVEVPLNAKGRTSNYLLEGVFDADKRSPEIDRLIDEFNAMIKANRPNSAKKLLQRITAEVDGDDPELLVLKNRLRKISVGS